MIYLDRFRLLLFKPYSTVFESYLNKILVTRFVALLLVEGTIPFMVLVLMPAAAFTASMAALGRLASMTQSLGLMVKGTGTLPLGFELQLMILV